MLVLCHLMHLVYQVGIDRVGCTVESDHWWLLSTKNLLALYKPILLFLMCKGSLLDWLIGCGPGRPTIAASSVVQSRRLSVSAVPIWSPWGSLRAAYLWSVLELQRRFFLFNFVLLLCRFHIIYPNTTHLPIPSHLPSALATSTTKVKQKKIKRNKKGKKNLTVGASVWHSNRVPFCPYILTCK